MRTHMTSPMLARQRQHADMFRVAVIVLLAASALVGCAPGEPENPGTPPRASLVTTDQYLNSLSYVFGPSIDLEVLFPPLERTHGLLANGAAIAGVTNSQLEQFQSAAANVSAQVVDKEHRNYLIPCQPVSDEAADEACATEFLSKTGRLLYRRPLTDAELDTYVEIAGEAADTLENFYAGLRIALEGVLISPEVLFVVETAEPDPETPGKLRLDAYSLASRLSYFLWNAAPDDQLLDAAASGELLTEDGRARAVDRMLASPRLVDGMRAFFDDMFHFDEFATLAKDPSIYPDFTRATAVAAREQTLRTAINHLIVEKKDYRNLFTTRSTFMSPALAIMYDIPTPLGWTPYTLPPDSPRAGVLTQISFLSLYAHPGRSSVTLRGKALREVFLCQVVPPPPPGVDFTIVNNPDSHYPTQRERVKAHSETPSCAGCHRIMDPIGLALENFDGAGSYRKKENGVVIDTSGNLDGVKYENALGLTQALHDNPALPQCLVQRVVAYGTGGNTGTEDRAFMTYLNEGFAAEGYRLPALLRTIALSDAFSRIKEPQSPSPAEQEPDSDKRKVTLPSRVEPETLS